MRYRSEIDALVENALNELEEEFESEFEDHLDGSTHSRRLYKWILSLPVWNDRGDKILGWRKSLEEPGAKPMTHAETRKPEEDIIAKWARQVDKKVKRIAITRCFVNDDNDWQADLTSCKEVDLARGLPAVPCARIRPRGC